MADWYHVYLTAWVNQFKIKDACIEFVINNVSRQGNVKIKFNLKIEEICRNCSPNFLWNKWQRTKILFSPIRDILITLWNTSHEVFCKNIQRLNTANYFCRKLHLRCFTGFWIRLWLSKYFFFYDYLTLPLWIFYEFY